MRMGELGPLIPDESSRASRALRRVRGISLILIAFILVSALSPLLLLAAVIVDASLWLRRRKPWMAVRLLAMLWWFLLGELWALVGLLLIWVTSPGGDSARRRERTYALKRRWLSSHLGGIRLLFGMRFQSEGLELAGPGPELIMIRHASIIDNALSDVIVGRAHHLGLRFILKRELQMIPTIDIGGRWVPTLFVRRASGDIERELERMRMLAVNMSEHDALLIYPEGTRATPAKIARAKQVIAERQPGDRAACRPPSEPASTQARRPHRAARGIARSGRGAVRARRPGRLRVHQRHLGGRAGRDHRADEVLALPGIGGPDRPRRDDPLAV